jgi:phospholipase/lecithinase/hemolysin
MQKLIGMGATDIVVPGVLPIGCFPIYLTIYQSSNSSDYDDLGCLTSFNDLSTYHNTLLQKRVDIIQSRHRKTARIMYADFYSAVYDMVRNPQTYGTSVRSSTSYCLRTASLHCCGRIVWPGPSSHRDRALSLFNAPFVIPGQSGKHYTPQSIYTMCVQETSGVVVGL